MLIIVKYQLNLRINVRTSIDIIDIKVPTFIYNTALIKSIFCKLEN